MKRGWWALGFVGVLAACESTSVPKTDIPDSPDPTVDAGVDGAPLPPPPVAPKVAPIGKQTIVIGKSVTFRVTLERGSLAGPLEMTIAGLPAGVTAKSEPIAAEASAADVTLSATENVSFGTSKASVQVGKDASLSAPFDLEVRGVPGTLDKSFGVEGSILVSDRLSYFAVMGDGAFVGQTQTGRLTKRTANGAPDTSFGAQGGVEIADFVGGGLHINVPAVPVLDATGNVYVAHEYPSPGGTSTRRAVVARLTPRGTADPTFGSGGLAQLPELPEGSRHGIRSITLLDDGTIIVASVVTNGGTEAEDKLLLRRVTKSGTLDTTWGTTGDGTVLADAPRNALFRVYRTATGGIYLAAMADSLWQGQWTKDGAVDRTFGLGQGYTRTPNFLPSVAARLFDRRRDGSLDVGFNEGDYARTARYTPNGIADTTYVSQPTQIPARPQRSRVALADSLGRTYFGFQEPDPTLIDLWRLNANGTIDGTLNGTGRFRFTLPLNIAGPGSALTSIHELTDGRIEAFIGAYSGTVAFRFWP